MTRKSRRRAAKRATMARVPRLDILLSRNLGIGRRQVVRLLRAGRVSGVDGQRLDDPRLGIEPSNLPHQVVVDDEPVTLHHRFHLAQHKPCGVVTALRDRRHDTAFDLLPDSVPLRGLLRPVGRLDRDTSGLLLWTTDGALLHRLTHPRYAVPREYHVAVAGPYQPLPPALVLADGYAPVIDCLEPLTPAQAHPGLTIPDAASVLARIVVHAGKFHEVRRIFAALGTEVLGLCRVRYGSVALDPALAPGGWAFEDLHARFSGLHPAT